MNGCGFPPVAGVPLGRREVNIASIQVIPVASVEVITMAIEGVPCDLALRVVDVQSGVAWLIPMDANFAARHALAVTAKLDSLDTGQN